MTAPYDSNERLWEFLGNLWDRSTGGADVAARPDKNVDDVWPSATRPPGVSEGLAWLASEKQDEVSRILLLVGGPGAGKSHATTAAVQGMKKATEMEDGLAHRAYQYRGDHRNLLVVNDATISDDSHATPLVADMDNALSSRATSALPTDVMACINRGILIEEVGQLPGKAESAGALVVSWLAEDRVRLGSFSLESCVYLPYGRSAELRSGGDAVAHVIAIFVDECSLFEVSPRLEIKKNMICETGAYKVHRLPERRGLGAGGQRVPAADLLEAVLATIDEQVDAEPRATVDLVDPVIANLQSLRSPTVRASILTLARSAELATSIRMTYRELWGFVARVLVGSGPERLSRERLGSFIRDNQPKGVCSQADFDSLRRLSALRLTQGIFGAGAEPTAPTRIGNDPVLRLTVAVDPMLDALPGNKPSNPRAGWADPVHEAFSWQSKTTTPLAALIAGVAEHEDVPPPSEVLADIVCQFDWDVDAAYTKLMADDYLSDAERLKASSWYGAYLTRLYGVGLGISAFRREVDALIEAMATVPRLPDVLRKPMETLLRPKRQLRDGETEALLPLFDSRTEPIVGHLVAPKMALRVEDGKMHTFRGRGDQVFLELRHETELQGRINIDFALVREALACIDDHSGVTNLVDVTAPRLERVRSSMLRSTLLENGEIRIASGTDSKLVTLSSY